MGNWLQGGKRGEGSETVGVRMGDETTPQNCTTRWSFPFNPFLSVSGYLVVLVPFYSDRILFIICILFSTNKDLP